MIQFDAKDCHDLKSALSREWLETNGLGGFASSTIIGLNTRRYHGLLTAAVNPPVGRMVLLSKLEETLVIDGKRYDLSTNQYSGAIHPLGFQYLREFRLDPFPIFTFVVNGIEIEKCLFMVYKENTTVIQYQVRSSGFSAAGGAGIRNGQIISPLDRNVVLELRPLIAFRDYHSTTHANALLNDKLQIHEQWIKITPYPGLPDLAFSHDADVIDSNSFWFYNFEYEREKERGLDFKEDLFSPFALNFHLSNRRTICSVIASTIGNDIKEVGLIRHAELHRRKDVRMASPGMDEFFRELVSAADQFIVGRKEQKTIMAGYHWFGDWGRDTMIALPGLTLITGQTQAAKDILSGFAKYADQGMLPNRFPETGEIPEYNTVDAALWYFEAVRSFLQHTGDHEFIRTVLYPVLTSIMAWHLKGTRYGIHMDQDGLLSCGQEGVALTWMDAKVEDWIVTPRRGKPVEIQALWYNALCVMSQLAKEFNDSQRAERYQKIARRTQESFNQLFWNESSGCLYDVVKGDSKDKSIRPNQIFAVSLFYSMLSFERSKQVVLTVERELLTPFGLRSLAPSDPQYHSRYEGDSRSRDGAYHQGTVWAWLMGPFISAYIKVHDQSERSRQKAWQCLEGLRTHLNEAGLGQISEIFDGDSPHTPRGCIAQAWSVAEILRVSREDIGDSKKKENSDVRMAALQ